ncbi:MAG: cell division protein FtsK [bacterium]|nr:cell division protein FtsK [bacterium]
MRALGAAFLSVLGIGLLIALLTHRIEDPSWNSIVGSQTVLQNWLGLPGAISSDILLQLFGPSSLCLGITFLCWSFLLGVEKKISHSKIRIFLLLFSLTLLDVGTSVFFAKGGGAIGSLLFSKIYFWVNRWDFGPEIFGGLVFVIGTLGQLYVWGLKSRHLAFFGRKMSDTQSALGTLSTKWFEAPLKAAKNQISQRIDPVIEQVKSTSLDEPFNDKNEEDFDQDSTPNQVFQPVSPPPRKSSSELVPINAAGELPPLDLLDTLRNQAAKTTIRDEVLQKRSEELQQTLTDYGVRGEITKVRPGPVVTLYELLPAAGVKASRVVALADDIARSMSSVSARVSTIPGHNAIGIELPNLDREMVGLKELIQDKTYQEQDEKLPLILGKDIGGLPVIADLARMPHLLVAGTTGSGKSVAINTMVLSLLYRLTPSQCRFIMIDPKMLELSVYNGIPHLLCPVVTEPKKAVVALKWAVKEMENRYRAMSHLGVRNIDNYNDRLTEARDRKEQITRRIQTGFDPDSGKPLFEDQPLDLSPLPYIVVIVDEMADLMLVAGKDVEAAIQRLAQMARAAGIHLIMATQRPSVDVITGTIKANFPTRISFQVTSKIDSRTILGEQGAEQLLGRGDMLYMAGGGRVTRVHGPFVKDEEVEKVVDHLRQTGVPDYSEEITTEEDGETGISGAAGGNSEESSDPFYNKAIDLVRREQKASTSFVQRHLQIGYNRAARLIDQMENAGIISSANHVGRREVLMPPVEESA